MEYIKTCSIAAGILMGECFTNTAMTGGYTVLYDTSSQDPDSVSELSGHDGPIENQIC